MKITVLPYIDPADLEKTNTVSKPAEPAVKTPSASEEDFKTTLEAAQKALSALTVDLITSQDAEKIREAANILSSSKVPQLQEIGEALNKTSDTVEKSKAESASDEKTDAASKASATDKTDDMKLASTETTSAAKESTDVSSSTLKSVSDALGCPEEYRPYFKEASETYGVEVAFLEAVAKAESSFKRQDVSSAGAMGIMQLMPATAKELGVDNPYDARENIMGGAKLLSSLLSKYNGNKELALAAYNAGSGNVEKYGGIPPFTETQTYVPRVLGFYADATR